MFISYLSRDTFGFQIAVIIWSPNHEKMHYDGNQHQQAKFHQLFPHFRPCLNNRRTANIIRCQPSMRHVGRLAKFKMVDCKPELSTLYVSLEWKYISPKFQRLSPRFWPCPKQLWYCWHCPMSTDWWNLKWRTVGRKYTVPLEWNDISPKFKKLSSSFSTMPETFMVLLPLRQTPHWEYSGKRTVQIKTDVLCQRWMNIKWAQWGYTLYISKDAMQ
jgi:hypothetical protein